MSRLDEYIKLNYSEIKLSESDKIRISKTLGFATYDVLGSLENVIEEINKEIPIKKFVSWWRG
jgi:hypothetical protein